MAAAIESAFPGADVVLNPGGRGDFIVTVGGEEIWNKRAQDDAFPDEVALVSRIESDGGL